jgi:hypothetical protein
MNLATGIPLTIRNPKDRILGSGKRQLEKGEFGQVPHFKGLLVNTRIAACDKDCPNWVETGELQELVVRTTLRIRFPLQWRIHPVSDETD